MSITIRFALGSDLPALVDICLVAILTSINVVSIGLLKKLGFEEWGNLPGIIDIEGERASHLFYGIDAEQA